MKYYLILSAIKNFKER